MKAQILLSLILIPAFLVGQPNEELRTVWLTNVDSNVLFSDKSIAEAMDHLASIASTSIGSQSATSQRTGQ